LGALWHCIYGSVQTFREMCGMRTLKETKKKNEFNIYEPNRTSVLKSK